MFTMRRLFKLGLFTVFFAMIHLASSETITNCSAMHAFVKVRGLGIKNNTLTSAQALFPPHTYYVPWTSLVQLSSDDDICDTESALTTDITNKIVLLFEETGECSVHYKVLSAQQKGAIAVLMSNEDLTGEIVNIMDDATLNETDPTIPMRSISLYDAQLLSDEITMNRQVEIQFGCFDATYPTALCLSDPIGEYEYGDAVGTYQQQEQRSYNSHPIWVYPGYRDLREDFTIYLHDAHGDDDWFWAVTSDQTLQFDDWILFICQVRGSAISDPSLCPLWLGTYDYGETWEPLDSINVTLGLCPVLIGEEQHVLCFDSLQHTVGGLRGTYRLVDTMRPEWWRDITDCDERSGVIQYIPDGYYGTAYFIAMEPLNWWKYSLCDIPRNYSENGTFATMKWRPDLCMEWKTRNDYDLVYSQYHRYFDETMNVTRGECSAERMAIISPPCDEGNPPDTMCLSNNSIMHGFAMGEYARVEGNATGPIFDSVIYERVNYFDPYATNQTNKTYYIYYANEFYGYAWPEIDDWLHGREWILTEHSLEEAKEKEDETGEYELTWFGHCAGWSNGNPMACSGWVFWYWNAFHYDEQFTMTKGECTTDTIPPLPGTWPDYICINLINESLPYGNTHTSQDSLDIDTFTAAFTINRSSINGDDAIPYWEKLHNDFYDDDMYITFDSSWGGHWFVYNSTLNVIMICDVYGNAKTMNPMDCPHWYDRNLHLMDNIIFEECTTDDVISASPTSAPSAAPTKLPTENERFCLSRNGSITSALEGIYVNNGVNYDEFGTFDFQRVTTNVVDNTESLYVWYHNQGWWISPVHYLEKAERDPTTVDVFGYCRGGERGNYPVCEGDWYFFLDVHPLSLGYDKGKKMRDTSFGLSTDLSGCEEENDDVFTLYYPETLCINNMGRRDTSHVHPYNRLDDVPTAGSLSQFIGEYVFVYSDSDETGADIEYYKHLESDKLYMRHHKINNHWYIGTSPDPKHIDLVCTDYHRMPSICLAWDNSIHDVVYVDNLISITEECIVNEGKKSGNVAKVVGTVIAILFGIICCGVIIFLCLKCNRDKTHQPVIEETENEMGTLATGGATEGNVVPDEEPLGTTTKGDDAYDMEALNTTENQGDDEDPLTE